MRIEPFLDSLASSAIQELLGTEAPAVLRPTQDPTHGDYQVNGVLPLAKQLRKNPRELAAPLAAKLAEHEAIAAAEVAGPGFVNVRLDDAWIAARLREMLVDRERDGVPTVEAPQTVIVDYSSPNIAKQMHVGNLRSTIIGDALARMLRFVGHRVVGDNHIGDWGTQYGLLLVGMREWGSQEALDRDPLAELERVYTLASKRAKDDEAFADRARAELAKLQAGDAENRRLWAQFVDATKRSLEVIYDRLGVRFDEWLGESAYDDMLPGVVTMLVEKGIAREDQGAVCVFFNELDGVEGRLAKQDVPFIVRKKDGAFLYSTSDIAAVLYRRQRWSADRALYVVDKRQGGHFEQLFEVMRLLGEPMRLEHVGFGMVLGLDGKPISSRGGTALTLASLLDEAEERAAKLMEDEPLCLAPEVARELAPAVGIGAVKYADLSQNRTSDYRFDWDKLISFKGNSGPYVQYAHARCNGILRKGEVDASAIDPSLLRLEAPEEAALARRLLKLADAVHTASEQAYPHFIADHLYALARDYNAFQESCPVLKAEGATRESRLTLVDLTRRQLARGLALLGIEAPERI